MTGARLYCWASGLLLLGAALLPAAPAPADEPNPTRIHPALLRQLDQAEDGQVKAWVLFDLTDKGLASPEALEATLDNLASTYHPRAIQRRRLRRTLPGLFDIHDIPVSQNYIDQVRATGAEIRVVSRWVNGISVRADGEQLARLDALPFVKVIQPVRRGPKIEPTGVEPIPGGAAATGRGFYGAAEEQLTQINLIDLHDQGFTGDDVIVGILDTGFNRSHVAFNDISHPVDILTEWDFINDDGDTSYEEGDPENQHRHGTLILGVLGAYKPDELVGGAARPKTQPTNIRARRIFTSRASSSSRPTAETWPPPH